MNAPIFRGTLPETNSSPLKMDGWNTTFLLGRPIFRCYVSFREGILVDQSCLCSKEPHLRFDAAPLG